MFLERRKLHTRELVLILAFDEQFVVCPVGRITTRLLEEIPGGRSSCAPSASHLEVSGAVHNDVCFLGDYHASALDSADWHSGSLPRWLEYAPVRACPDDEQQGYRSGRHSGHS